MRRRTLALVGVAFVAAYVVSAAISGHLSLLSRAPLLDGSAPQQAYRWVNPPAALAPTNIAPSGATTDVPMGPKGNETVNLVTNDRQVILVLAPQVVPPHGHDTRVRVDIEPVDPATLAPLGHGLSAFGNAYRVTGTYLPSKTPVTELAKEDPATKRPGTLDVVLTYPVTADLYSHKHTVLYAPTSTAPWQALKSTDLLLNQQVEALPPGMGYVVVGGVPGPAVISSSPVAGSGRSTNTVTIALGLVAVAAFLIGLGLVLRNGRKR